MPAKPEDIKDRTIHQKWPKEIPFKCPIYNKKVVHMYNDGGRRIKGLKKHLWVMTNYYRCINPECQLSKPFSFPSGLALYRKRFGIDVWERIIRFRFNRNFNNMGSFIMNHGEYYSRLESFDFDSYRIHEVLLMVQRGFSRGGVGAWRLVGIEAHPDWRVREHDVGNLSVFEVLVSCSR
ncbi:MAG: hypothetical protein ACTSWN_15250 [Promethearchaeota archaeon]